MRYVVDASVALTAVLPGPLQAKALQLQTDYQNRIHDLLAPDIFIAETANALTKTERQKLIKWSRSASKSGSLSSFQPALMASRRAATAWSSHHRATGNSSLSLQDRPTS